MHRGFLAIYGPHQSRYYRQEVRKTTLLKQPTGHFLHQNCTHDNSPRDGLRRNLFLQPDNRHFTPKGHRYPTHHCWNSCTGLDTDTDETQRNSRVSTRTHPDLYLVADSSWTLSPLPMPYGQVIPSCCCCYRKLQLASSLSHFRQETVASKIPASVADSDASDAVGHAREHVTL